MPFVHPPRCLKWEPLGAAGAELAALYAARYAAGPAPTVAERDIALTPVIVSNHISYLDGMVLAALFGAPKIVAHEGSRRTPIIGKLMEEMDTIFGLLDFRKGAFAAGAPVRPVLIVYTGAFDPASTTYRMTADGPVECSDKEWATEIMGHFIHSLHVRVLPPYLPTDAERADPAAYARGCCERMRAELARVRDELHRGSWQIGDELRIAARRISTGMVGALGDKMAIFLRTGTGDSGTGGDAAGRAPPPAAAGGRLT
eukprot:gene6368-26976_t